MGDELSTNDIKELEKIHSKIKELNRRAIEILSKANQASKPPPPPSEFEEEPISFSSNKIHIYTDGACSGNPGPAGSGVVIIQDGKVLREISKSLGKATNNIAELTAIKIGLQLVVPNYSTEITIYTDSTYAIGILTKNWKAKANVELVSSIRKLIRSFKKLTIIHVKGHSGDPGNELADSLAVKAIESLKKFCE